MKKQIKFNHEAPTLTESIGMDQNTISSKLSGVSVRFIFDNGRKSHTHLMEMIHESMSYEEMLVITTMFAVRQLNEQADEIIEILNK